MGAAGYVDDVHRVMTSVGDNQVAAGGGSSEGQVPRHVPRVAVLHLKLEPHLGGRMQGGGPQGAHEGEAGFSAFLTHGGRDGGRKAVHTEGVVLAVGGDQQTQGGARSDIAPHPAHRSQTGQGHQGAQVHRWRRCRGSATCLQNAVEGEKGQGREGRRE